MSNLSLLDPGQVIKDVHDPANNALKVNLVAGGGITVDFSQTDDAAFAVGTDKVAMMGALADETGPDSVDEGDAGAVRMSLNRNLYSQIRDGLGNERGASVSATNALKVDGSAVTQPVSGTVTAAQGTAANLNATVVGTGTFAVQASQSGTWNITNISGTVSLPTGAATETTLSSLNAKVTTVNTGAVTISTALPAGTNAIGKLAANDGVDIGDVTINNAAGASAVNIQDGGNSITVDGTVTAAQGTAANLNATVVGTGTFAVQAAQSGTWNITNISGTVSLPTGAATESTLSTLNGKIPSNLTVTSTRLLVDGSGVTQPISDTRDTASTASLSNVSGSASSVSLLASNAARKSAYFFNDSTAILYIKFGTTASVTSYTVQVQPGGFYEMPNRPTYTGAIDGIWSAANGAARITEI